MSHNTFGHLFRVTTFGESHGIAIGCVVDGCPPRIPLEAAEIQRELDRRRPGQSRFTTQRQELDQVKILSGVFTDEVSGKQVTTGTPIALLIENVDQRSKDYSDIKDKYRPGHAGYVYDVKYGLHDYRGGGRASARETAMRVTAGAIARKVVPGMSVRAALVQMGPHKVDRARWDWNQVGNNPFFCPDAQQAKFYEGYLDDIRKSGSSIGAVIEVVADGVPAGLGSPVYAKLDAELASALMGINAVKGVEIGDGFATAELRGEENADESGVRPERFHEADFSAAFDDGSSSGSTNGESSGEKGGAGNEPEEQTDAGEDVAFTFGDAADDAHVGAFEFLADLQCDGADVGRAVPRVVLGGSHGFGIFAGEGVLGLGESGDVEATVHARFLS